MFNILILCLHSFLLTWNNNIEGKSIFFCINIRVYWNNVKMLKILTILSRYKCFSISYLIFRLLRNIHFELTFRIIYSFWFYIHHQNYFECLDSRPWIEPGYLSLSNLPLHHWGHKRKLHFFHIENSTSPLHSWQGIME